MLRLRDRARLDDPDDVTDGRSVLLVVRVQLMATADDLLVARVQLGRVDRDDDRLVALVGDDEPTALLAPTELRVPLRRLRDRLARRRLLASGLRVLVPERAREALALAGQKLPIRTKFVRRESDLFES